METIPWYRSAIIRQQIVALIVAVLGLIGITTDVNWDETVGAILAGIGALISVYTIITRMIKPTPPITQEQAAKAVAMQAKLRSEK